MKKLNEKWKPRHTLKVSSSRSCPPDKSLPDTFLTLPSDGPSHRSSPVPSDEHFLVRKRPIFSLACQPLHQSPPEKPSLETVMLFSHSSSPNELKFAKHNSPLMPNVLKFSSRSEQSAKSLPNFSDIRVGILLSLQKPFPKLDEFL